MPGSPRVLAWPGFNQRENPYTPLLYGALRDAGLDVVDFSAVAAVASRRAVLHVHWPEAFLDVSRHPRIQAAAQLAVMRVVRARGGRVIWTVHNLTAHGRRYPDLERRYMRRFLGLVDGWIALTSASQAEIVATYPPLGDRPHAVIPHGHYRDVYPPLPTDQRSDVPTVLAFGQIRSYKAIPALIRAFRTLEGGRLRVVGSGAPADVAECRAAALGDARVSIEEGFVPPADVPGHFAGADLVALAYASGLNSGAALLALSFERPVLLPATPTFLELQSLAGTDWVRTYDGDLDGPILADAIEWSRRPRPPIDLSSLEWPRIATATAAFYEQVLSRRSSSRSGR